MSDIARPIDEDPAPLRGVAFALHEHAAIRAAKAAFWLRGFRIRIAADHESLEEAVEFSPRHGFDKVGAPLFLWMIYKPPAGGVAVSWGDGSDLILDTMGDGLAVVIDAMDADAPDDGSGDCGGHEYA